MVMIMFWFHDQCCHNFGSKNEIYPKLINKLKTSIDKRNIFTVVLFNLK